MNTHANMNASQILNDALADITKSIASYEAKNLSQRKKDLEKVIGRIADASEGYNEEYPDLRKKWGLQSRRIADIWKTLQCHYPDDKLKELVCECICGPLADIKRRTYEREWRSIVPTGIRERKRDETAAWETKAKAELDAALENTKGVGAILKENDALLTVIEAQLSRDDRAAAIWAFLFKVVPAHRQLTPADAAADKDCAGLLDKIPTPYDLCPPPENKCPPLDCGCPPPDDSDDLPQDKPKPPDEPEDPDDADCEDDDEEGKEPDSKQKAPTSEKATQSASDKSTSQKAPQKSDKDQRSFPWLIPVEDYEDAIACLWLALGEASQAAADAKTDFDASPDDLATRIAELKALEEALEGTVTDCLKQHIPENPCAAEAAPEHVEA